MKKIEEISNSHRQGCYICANLNELYKCEADWDEKGLTNFCLKALKDCLTCQNCTCKSFRLKNNITSKCK
jgi:hypothetical protein